MGAFESKLNDLLMDTFRNILKVEELMVQRDGTNLTLSEIHLIEAVGDAKDVPRTVTEIADALGITTASVTVAVGKLMRKNYLAKEKSPEDGRSVYITLTKAGEKIYRLHRYFHITMVRSVATGISNQEKDALLAGVEKLDNFFKNKAVELLED